MEREREKFKCASLSGVPVWQGERLGLERKPTSTHAIGTIFRRPLMLCGFERRVVRAEVVQAWRVCVPASTGANPVPLVAFFLLTKTVASFLPAFRFNDRWFDGAHAAQKERWTNLRHKRKATGRHCCVVISAHCICTHKKKITEIVPSCRLRAKAANTSQSRQQACGLALINPCR